MDVCVVGAGAAGSVVAKELAEVGLKVVVLESGGTPDASRIATTRDDWELEPLTFTPPERPPGITLDDVSARFHLSRYRGTGGSTMHYEGFAVRMHPEDWTRKSQFGTGADWPLRYEELTRAYDRVERFLCVSGERDNPFEPQRPPYPLPAIPMSCAVRRSATGARKLGLHPAHAPLAILSRNQNDERRACNYCGGCWSGCAVGAISNSGNTYIPAALRAGATLRNGCTASRIVMGRHGGYVTGVEFLDSGGSLHLQSARAIVLCGNAIETARLLLLSAQAGCLDGMANSSGLVGRNLVGHTLVVAEGMVEERVNGYMGPNINGMLQDFYAADTSRGYVGGYLVALRNAELGPVHFYRRWLHNDGLFGRGLYRRMDAEFGHSLNVCAFGEQTSNPGNSVTLDPVARDRFGLPLPRLSLSLDMNDIALQDHAELTLRTLLEASGAQPIRTRRTTTIMGNHLLGTARMGHDCSTSVTNSFGRTHDVRNLFVADGSLFPTSTPANPTLTIQAMATRVAEHVAHSMATGAI